METILTQYTLYVMIKSYSRMNLIFGLVYLMSIISLTTAQSTIIKCSDHNDSKNKSGILLDCSNMADKSYPYTIEKWLNDGILANRIWSINLEYNNLQYIFKFPSMRLLKKISFKFNNITEIVNYAFVMLPGLEELDLSFNSIDSHVLRLNNFYMDKRQKIVDTNEKAVLKTLKLGYNNIHSLSPFLFEYLKNLEWLELNNNPMVVIDQNTEIALGCLKHLQYLDLGNTGISEIPADAFTRLSSVRTLYLNGNQFQTIPKEIRTLPLTFLNINSNPISHLDNESFVGLDQLQEVIISGMPQLIEIGSGTFAPLKRLVTLHISQNPNLTNIHYDAFRDTTTSQWPLKHLYLCNTNLSSLDSKLYQWSKLDVFDAKSNRWTCDCRLSWLASYINDTFAKIPENLPYYRCYEPEDLSGILISQLNEHIACDELVPPNHSHGHVTRLKHFIIVIGLVIGILVIGTLINIGCREIMKILKPRIYVQSPFSAGIKYRPADFEESTDTSEVPFKNPMTHGRSPIVINNTD